MQITRRTSKLCKRKSFSVRALLTVAVLLSTTGCASLFGPSRTESAAHSKRLKFLEREIKRKDSVIEDLRERNQVLEKRSQNQQRQVASASVPVPFEPSAANDRFNGVPAAAPAPAAPPPAPAVAAVKPATVLPPKAPVVREEVAEKATGEQMLYSKVLDSYRKHNSTEMQKAIMLLRKTYPDSIFADNALYLGGLLAMEAQQPTEALKYMDEILRSYPSGNKSVAALLAKGMIERRLGRKEQAKRLLNEVRSRFPGSPEAARASIELKLLDVSGGQHQRGM